MSKTALVTGANGNIGHRLIPVLKSKEYRVIALDIRELSGDLSKIVDESVTASILDQNAINNVFQKDIDVVFHLASNLAIPSELDPEEAHQVNATGTVALLAASLKHSENTKKEIQFIFPSSISVYGLPDLQTKESVVVTEDEYVNPQTIYGITKLYCEQLGIYYSDRYKILDAKSTHLLDFRALRFPGIIASLNLNEIENYAGLSMIHSPVDGSGYELYVNENTVLPFMVMEDAVNALITLSEADRQKLTRRVYNVSGFAAPVSNLINEIKNVYPKSEMNKDVNSGREEIVATWPQAVDDSKAKEDWGWSAKLGLSDILAK